LIILFFFLRFSASSAAKSRAFQVLDELRQYFHSLAAWEPKPGAPRPETWKKQDRQPSVFTQGAMRLAGWDLSDSAYARSDLRGSHYRLWGASLLVGAARQVRVSAQHLEQVRFSGSYFLTHGTFQVPRSGSIFYCGLCICPQESKD